MSNSTIAENTAERDGGGIFRNRGTIDLTNAIVATNIANRSGNDLFGTFNTIENSLIGDTADATITRPSFGRSYGRDRTEARRQPPKLEQK